ncbi:MAG: hypothetical protein KHX31_11700 [Akkermansia sp.]|jgi:hypothetical protein|uniref:hypothetical protein n=1 Tax=Akkermansia sp. TaxID=1872421 RepID=UPI0025BCD20B|nr:hypothetical protein [Akkermansia sp.]MBS5509289.1 hypothetical protein [Akkermansia sp.]
MRDDIYLERFHDFFEVAVMIAVLFGKWKTLQVRTWLDQMPIVLTWERGLL